MPLPADTYAAKKEAIDRRRTRKTRKGKKQNHSLEFYIETDQAEINHTEQPK